MRVLLAVSTSGIGSGEMLVSAESRALGAPSSSKVVSAAVSSSSETLDRRSSRSAFHVCPLSRSPSTPPVTRTIVSRWAASVPTRSGSTMRRSAIPKIFAGSGPVSTMRSGPILPVARAARTATMRATATPATAASRRANFSETSLLRRVEMRPRTRNTAATIARTHGTRLPTSGSMPSTGIAGSGALVTPSAEKFVPAPTAKPGPSSHVRAQMTNTGRYINCVTTRPIEPPISVR